MDIIRRPSPNFNDRPQSVAITMVVMHYTNMPDAALALDRLCDPEAKVSAHYLIDEAGTVFSLVAEDKRAWHAGVAYWQGERDINGCSLGIELAHQGPAADGTCVPFPSGQMRALADLLSDISTRHDIPPARFLGHSDVAPARKRDPGEMFDWDWLAGQGFGQISDVAGETGKILDTVSLQAALARFGYEVSQTGQFDDVTRQAVTAFQRHHRRGLVDGVIDAMTCARLLDLLSRAR
ncbi:MAG: N-acetylmuramoyl-L-alanine amidase [Parvibaculales bacterium]